MERPNSLSEFSGLYPSAQQPAVCAGGVGRDQNGPDRWGRRDVRRTSPRISRRRPIRRFKISCGSRTLRGLGRAFGILFFFDGIWVLRSNLLVVFPKGSGNEKMLRHCRWQNDPCGRFRNRKDDGHVEVEHTSRHRRGGVRSRDGGRVDLSRQLVARPFDVIPYRGGTQHHDAHDAPWLGAFLAAFRGGVDESPATGQDVLRT